MSHFTVLVLTPHDRQSELEERLQPFHEFECTGTNDRYVLDVDVTAECQEHGLDWYGLEDLTITSLDQLDKANTHKYGYALLDADGNLLKAVNRTNPNKKWDWWTVGGRWNGILPVKRPALLPSGNGDEGVAGLRGGEINFLMDLYLDDRPRFEALVARYGVEKAEEITAFFALSALPPRAYVNSAPLREIDWDSIKEKELAEAEKTYTTFHTRWASLPPAQATDKDLEKWQENVYIRAAFPDVHDFARWNQQQPTFDDDFFWVSWTEMQALRFLTLDAYVAQAHSALTYALVDQNGNWLGRGEMGWFGMDSNHDQTYDQKFWETIANTPENWYATVVDCHI